MYTKKWLLYKFQLLIQSDFTQLKKFKHTKKQYSQVQVFSNYSEVIKVIFTFKLKEHEVVSH